MKKLYLITIAVLTLLCFLVVSNAWSKGSHRHAKKNKKHHHLKVKTKYGQLMGISDENNTWAWKGIPYARPPVSDLRWKAPKAPRKWKGVRDAKEECEPCTQLYTTSKWIRQPYAIGSEDCLYLNIWRPQSREKKLPVYVWIHGGSNNFGKAEDYNGSVLASKSNVVVVVVQYRLGPLGWFTHPELRSGKKPKDDSGNYGTLDTIQALKWVQKNIKAFGGDPHNVLITGESAGAHNVMNLVTSPLAEGLFQKAMSQSGGMTTDTFEEGELQAQDAIDALLEADGFSEVPEGDVEGYLRSKTSHEILEAYFAKYKTLPTYDAYQDGYVLPDKTVVAAIRAGEYNQVPIILGANEYETKSFMPLYGPAIGLPSWYGLISVLDGTIPSVDFLLPTQNDKDLYELSGYYGSRNWRAKFVDERARALKDQPGQEVYAYQFNWGGKGSGPSPFDFIYGAGHAMEIAFFFGGDTSMWGYSFNPENDTAGRVDLKDKMMAYLANFAHTGDPNGSDLPDWTQWDNNGASKAIIFDSDFDQALIEMSDEEISIAGVEYEYVMDMLTRQVDDPVFWSFDTTLPGSYGWVPGYFQWSLAE